MSSADREERSKRRIYADFNGCCTFPNDDTHEYLDLCGYGTIGSLSHEKIRLKEGLTLTFVEPGDIEVEAVVVFMPEQTDRHNHGGKWFAKFRKGSIVESDEHDYSRLSHVCFNCRFDLEAHFEEVGRQYIELCPECDTPIMYPLSPPDAGAH